MKKQSLNALSNRLNRLERALSTAATLLSELREVRDGMQAEHDRQEQAKQLRLQGMTQKDIARVVGTSANTVSRRLEAPRKRSFVYVIRHDATNQAYVGHTSGRVSSCFASALMSAKDSGGDPQNWSPLRRAMVNTQVQGWTHFQVAEATSTQHANQVVKEHVALLRSQGTTVLNKRGSRGDD